MEEVIENNKKEVLTIDSLTISKMLERRHDYLLRDIDFYKKILDTNPELGVDNYFIDSSYISKQNKKIRCYLVTKLGCKVISNRLIGKKALLFTASYVKKFKEMEEELNNKKTLPTNYKEALLQLVAAEEEKERLIAVNKETLLKLVEAEEEKQRLIALNKETNEILSQQPKAQFREEFLDTTKSYSVKDISLTFAIPKLGRNNFYKYLRDKKIIIDGTTQAYKKYEEEGYVVHRVAHFCTSTGEKSKLVVGFTNKGVVYLYNQLIQDNYVMARRIEDILSDLKNKK